MREETTNSLIGFLNSWEVKMGALGKKWCRVLYGRKHLGLLRCLEWNSLPTQVGRDLRLVGGEGETRQKQSTSMVLSRWGFLFPLSSSLVTKQHHHNAKWRTGKVDKSEKWRWIWSINVRDVRVRKSHSLGIWNSICHCFFKKVVTYTEHKHSGGVMGVHTTQSLLSYLSPSYLVLS